MDEKKVLLYNLDENSNNGDIVMNIISELGFEIVTIDKCDLHKKVGFLIGLERFEGFEDKKESNETQKDDFEESIYLNFETVIFSGFNSVEIDLFLEKFNENKVEIPLKATVTEINKKWTLAYLLEQIADERKSYIAYFELKKVMSEAKEYLKNVKKDKRKNLQNELKNTSILMKKKGLDETNFKKAIKRIKDEMEKLK
ncbi:MAG: DUF3783 domain-containing protein [Clostridioides sp.]|jgi:hypothetical protein|nr:DUF3783 domain-containing protein [Clostridioides sp.]